MILYHGTSEYAALEAMTHGLKPRRQTGASNWSHTCESNASRVYLTNTYACFYAFQARLGAVRLPGPDNQIRNRIAVIEIDTKGLPFTNFRADEDYLVQFHPEKDKKLLDRQRDVRDIDSYSWKASLKALGTCAYAGTIPARNIRRVALFDYRQNRDIAAMMMDPVISPIAFSLCGSMHRNLTAWLFGAEVKASDLFTGLPDDAMHQAKLAYWDNVLLDRAGVEIKQIKHKATAKELL